jgi:HK97 family phage portal protein
MRVTQKQPTIYGPDNKPVKKGMTGSSMDFWTSAMFGSNRLANGSPLDFNEMAAQYKSHMYSCTTILGQAAADVPLKLYYKEIKSQKEVEWVEIEDHPFLDTWRNINSFMNNHEFVEMLITYLCLTGNAYIYVVDNVLEVPGEFYLLPSQRMKIIPGNILGEIKGYIYTVGGGKQIPLEESEIVQVKLPNPMDLFYGRSLVSAAALAIDHLNMMGEYESGMFDNAARPDIGIEVEGELNEESFQRLKQQVRNEFQGTKNTGKFLILEDIKDVKPLGSNMPMRDYAFLKGRSEVKDEIYNIWKVPISFGTQEDASRAHWMDDRVRLAEYGVKPHLVRIQEKINEKIMPRYLDGEKLSVEFDISSIIPQDREFRLRERGENIFSGYSTVDEERAKDGEGPRPDGKGDVVYIPFTMVPAGSEKVEESEEKALTDRVVETLADEVIKGMTKKTVGIKSHAEMMKLVKKETDGMRRAVKSEFKDLSREAAKIVGEVAGE